MAFSVIKIKPVWNYPSTKTLIPILQNKQVGFCHIFSWKYFLGSHTYQNRIPAMTQWRQIQKGRYIDILDAKSAHITHRSGSVTTPYVELRSCKEVKFKLLCFPGKLPTTDQVFALIPKSAFEKHDDIL
jgi:hypothetical protein